MTEHNFEQVRRAMVESQLRTTGVNDPRVVAAMGAVTRERFVPEGRSALAYADAAVPLGDGRALVPPMVLGRLLTESRLTGREHALVIGAATGYSAAVLAHIGLDVVALEGSAELARTARELGIETVEGQLDAGWKKGAPYGLILIGGAVEHIAEAIVDQVGEGEAHGGPFRGVI